MLNPLLRPLVLLVALAAAATGCQRAAPAIEPAPSNPTPSEPAPSDPTPSAEADDNAASGAASVVAAGAVDGSGSPVILAVGDVHGDLASARAALQLAGAVDAEGRWIGGDRTVVQIGDQTDRGDDERDILDWFDRLEVEAAEAGGAFWWLLGNHEIMNAQLDLRYVTPDGMADFADVPCAPSDTQCAAAPAEVRGRIAAFRPGGPYAMRLSRQPVVLVRGRTVFVHGGLEPHVAQLGPDTLNNAVAAWLRGEAPEPAFATGDDSPVWSRRFATEPTREDCAALAQTLQMLDADRMVVGHTVQAAGINSACDGQIWRIDVGLADAYGGPTQVLQIGPDGPTVLQ